MDGPRRSTSGFTLVELLLGMAIMAVLMLIAVGPLESFIHRSKIEAIARETVSLMQLARYEAIKRSVPAIVAADPTADRMLAFVDLDRNSLFTATDLVIGRYDLPRFVEFWAGDEVSPEGDNAMWNLSGAPFGQFARYLEDGSVVGSDTDTDGVAPYLPAFRFGDQRQNFLEVRVATLASGRIELRKWQAGAYRVQGENNQSWEWY